VPPAAAAPGAAAAGAGDAAAPDPASVLVEGVVRSPAQEPAGPIWLDPASLLARAARENFPVAPRWLPRALRRDLVAIYGFARLADELGDEAPGDRTALLAALEAELARAFEGRARSPLLARVGETVRARRLPREPFRRLIEANRRDQRVHRYATWSELEGYCRLSANPVGELVLGLFGAATPERVALSDAICTALQLIEHCQDVREDLARGRVYLPADEMARFGVRLEDLRRAPAPEGLRLLLAFQAGRARALLARGEALLGTLPPVARVCVAGFVAGGFAALDALARAGFDASSRARAGRRRDLARHAARLLWRARRGASR
jgi:squalene synthase HpnC